MKFPYLNFVSYLLVFTWKTEKSSAHWPSLQMPKELGQGQVTAGSHELPAGLPPG